MDPTLATYLFGALCVGLAGIGALYLLFRPDRTTNRKLPRIRWKREPRLDLVPPPREGDWAFPELTPRASGEVSEWREGIIRKRLLDG